MSRQLVYKKGNIIVVYCGNKNGYYTVVNTKKGTHCHVSKNNKKGAIMVCVRAFQGIIPDNYPEWLKTCIKRVIG